MPREDPITEEERKAHTAYDLIRMRLERLERNIHKPAPIPARKNAIKAPRAPPEFVRNVVGSSAAAGSAEFHIYRNNRRKEQNRLDYMATVAETEDKDKEYQAHRDAIKREEEAKTAKKRAKRQRAKQLKQNQKRLKKDGSDSDEENSDSNEDCQKEKITKVEEKRESSSDEEID